MRPLLLGPTQVAAIREVVAYAEQREHWYNPSPLSGVPGRNPRLVYESEFGYRAVFSISVDATGLYRHLSVSVPGPKLPNPAAVFELARQFGLTGGSLEEPGRDWIIKVDKKDNCIVLGQPWTPVAAAVQE